MLSPFLSLLLLALALSLDGFGVGITYGLRKMKIPLLSILIISLCSGIVIYVSMQVGVLLAKVVSPSIAASVGAVILILMGCWSLIQSRIQKEKEDLIAEQQEQETAQISTVSISELSSEDEYGEAAADSEGYGDESAQPAKPAVYSLELRRLGIVVQILRTPSSADMDASGSISPLEAMILGIALSLDAFGAGLGAALLGFNPGWTAVTIALFSGSFLIMGMKTGFKFAGSSWMKHAAVLPALMLIVMGIMKLL
ncbi:manganese efflux pump [Paenibacillus agri]|uniref:Manganese efflux pump n=1 Tax=Paenibacillus agri TaxID=2744309 RepID=A0A850EYD0_9BACL|nr:manganese efflux pump [Paenibacillus agri]NUU63912.1 manganese efflux pump [Paenibacillus agri]